MMRTKEQLYKRIRELREQKEMIEEEIRITVAEATIPVCEETGKRVRPVTSLGQQIVIEGISQWEHMDGTPCGEMCDRKVEETRPCTVCSRVLVKQGKRWLHKDEVVKIPIF